MEISQSKPAADLGTWIIFVCVLIPLWTDWVLYSDWSNGSLLIGLSNRIFDGIQN